MHHLILFMFLQFLIFIENHILFMHQNSSQSFDAIIGEHHKIFIGIDVIENRSTSEQLLQLLETRFTLFRPIKFNVLILQRGSRICYLQESFYKSLVIPNQAHKRTEIRYVLGCGPFNYFHNLFRVYRNTFFRDDDS